MTEIAAALAGEGTPVSAQTVWTILDAEGIDRLVRDEDRPAGHPDPAGPGQGPVAAGLAGPTRSAV